ncbi:MAG TPA: tRNA lysidine(34) synthetase TilS, partial [Longimicrobiales bacterium]|nr:tRNA lysidine(34) synthetase TilS [Longimicrobiales bacterium]
APGAAGPPAGGRPRRCGRRTMTGKAGGRGLTARFARHLECSALLQDVRRVVVAVSGGLDSVCLLHLLRFGRPGVELCAAHFDHDMRPGSAADAAWVRGLCAAWRVPLESARAHAPPRSEAEGRDLRYAFLQDVAGRVGAGAILTAHHADDQAETLLFRMIRGTGLAGMAGIPPRRGLLVRPLLPFSRADLHAYARHVRLGWREDPSNIDLRFARNRIRHVVLPALERVQPGAARRISRLARHAAEAEAAWRGILREAAGDVVESRDDTGFALARDRLLAYHPHVRARVLRHLILELGQRVDRTGTRAAVEYVSSGASGSRLELAGGVRLEREFDRMLLRHTLARPGPLDVPLEIPSMDPGSGTFVAGGQRYVASWASTPHGGDAASTASFDPSTLRFPLALRAWRPGDRIRLAYGSKKLKKLFQERQIGRSRRGGVPVLCDAEGAVLWVAGVARSSAALPGSGAAFTITVADGEPQRRA